MKAGLRLIGVVALIGCFAVAWTLSGAFHSADAAPKPKQVPPAVYVPATVQAGEILSVSVFNDDPNLAVAYVIQLVDVLTGAIVETINTSPVQPLEGVVLNHTPHNNIPSFIVIRGLDPNGAAYPVNLSSVQITDPTTKLIRFVPAEGHSVRDVSSPTLR